MSVDDPIAAGFKLDLITSEAHIWTEDKEKSSVLQETSYTSICEIRKSLEGDLVSLPSTYKEAGIRLCATCATKQFN